jgi:cytochrome P450
MERSMRVGTPSPWQRLKDVKEAIGFSNMVRFGRDPLGFLLELHQRGGMVPFRVSGRRFYVIAEPELVDWMFRQRSEVLTKDSFSQELRRLLGNGLLVNEGDFWRRQRGLMTRAFTPKRTDSYGEAMATISEGFASRLEDGQVLDIHDAMNRVTMEIVAKTLFDSDVAHEGGAIGRALELVMEFYANSPEAMFRVPGWVPTPRLRRFAEGKAVIDRVIGGIIEERRASGVDHGDLLSAMLEARESDGERMTETQLRDECVTLFVAGHETTAVLLAHLFVLLSKHPEVAARIRAEVAQVKGSGPLTVEDVRSLPYTEQVVHEGLRLYPSVWTVAREVVADCEVGGVQLAKGTQLLASQWAMHRDARYYENPEAFVPERWTPAFKKSLPRGAYFPFGDGPRVCIGNHFAHLEAMLILASIVQRWELDLLPGTRLEFAPSVTLRAQHVSMRVRARTPVTNLWGTPGLNPGQQPSGSRA